MVHCVCCGAYACGYAKALHQEHCLSKGLPPSTSKAWRGYRVAVARIPPKTQVKWWELALPGLKQVPAWEGAKAPL
eukprot:12900986-Prorocentrum_lima.AAC.1